MPARALQETHLMDAGVLRVEGLHKHCLARGVRIRNRRPVPVMHVQQGAHMCRKPMPCATDACLAKAHLHSEPLLRVPLEACTHEGAPLRRHAQPRPIVQRDGGLQGKDRD